MDRLSLLASFTLLFGVFVVDCEKTVRADDRLPPPYESPSTTKQSKVIGWPQGKMPAPPQGFSISLFADIKAPRNLYLMPNEDVLVAQAKKSPSDEGEDSPNQITRFTMSGSQLVSISIFAKNLPLVFGMAVFKDEFFAATPTQVLKYKLVNGQISGKPQIIASLSFPEPKRHWTRYILLKPDGSKLYVSAGSASNVGEDGDPLDSRNAAIMEMNRDGSQFRIVASGIRNAVSMAWEPTSRKMWAVVNERDEIGDNLPPDYLTSVRRGGFYGWPYAYWGKNEDPRLKGKRPDLVAKSLVPDYSLGAHTAALGIAFTHDTLLPQRFRDGALITLHGSWNRSVFSGYKVIYVPFKNGEPSGPSQDFLTGFIANESAGTVYGRPVSTLILKDGSVLVTDDGAGKIWKLTPMNDKSTP